MSPNVIVVNTPEVPIKRVIGVDFSGAALSGKTAWLAHADITEPSDTDNRRLILTSLQSLGTLAGDDARQRVNAFLVAEILGSNETLWGMDFPFALPIELKLGDWAEQLQQTADFAQTAKEFGRYLVQQAQTLGHGMHVRRTTDRETKTPFDCYHYRIIYQTFHGMRDILRPIASDRATCVVPFHYDRFASASRWIVEACPSSTLKRLDLPFRMYKQSSGKSATSEQKKVRKAILAAITDRQHGYIAVAPPFHRTIMNNPGGDALDAVLAAVGSFDDFSLTDHAAVYHHPRYRFEGRVFA